MIRLKRLSQVIQSQPQRCVLLLPVLCVQLNWHGCGFYFRETTVYLLLAQTLHEPRIASKLFVGALMLIGTLSKSLEFGTVAMHSALSPLDLSFLVRSRTLNTLSISNQLPARRSLEQFGATA